MTKSWNFACTVVFRSSNQPIKKFWPKGPFSPFLTLFEKILKKNLKKNSYMRFRSKNRPFLGRNRKNEPAVLETLGNYLFKSRILGQYLKKQLSYDFREKKIVSAIFARNSIMFAHCAKAQNLKKTKCGIFSSFLDFMGIKYV